MPDPLTKDLTRRLVFVRYLYELGVEQSHKPEPFAAVAVLTFHDACEMFLQIAAEHNGSLFLKSLQISWTIGRCLSNKRNHK
jgi:hypothetical protein